MQIFIKTKEISPNTNTSNLKPTVEHTAQISDIWEQ